MTPATDKVFYLANWVVHPSRHLIVWQNNADACQISERQLEPRLMRLLCELAAANTDVVTREALIEALWPRVVVNENSLTRAVSDLRQLLTPPDGTNTRFIETVPKKGYRLLTQIRSDNTAHHQAALTPPGTDSALRAWIPAMAAMILLTFSAALHWAPEQPSGLVLMDPAPQWQDSVISSSVSHQSVDALPAAMAAGSDFAATPLGQLPSEWRLDRAFDQPIGLSGTQFGQAVVAPNGLLMAYVDYFDGISRVNLRHAMGQNEPWVAFSTDEHIYHLQWSPLDSGLLFTVGLDTAARDRQPYLRLMLLDLDSLSVKELYRRKWQDSDYYLGKDSSLT